MRIFVVILLIIIALDRDGVAQTACGVHHTEVGIFICFPNAMSSGQANVSELFHFSAQINSAEDRFISGYSILIDNQVIYESKLPAPVKRLSIETNLGSPVNPGRHILRLAVTGIGSAELSVVQLDRSTDAILCDPFSRSDARVCNISKPGPPLRWAAAASEIPASGSDVTKPRVAFQGYVNALEIYSRNLKRLEADVSDAIATDSGGNLYTVSHVLADIEIRKYSPKGGIVYDSLIRACGDGFLQLTAVAVTDTGLVWVAGNTTACFRDTPNVIANGNADDRRMRGIVALVDTKRSNSEPLYLAHLAYTKYRVTALRADDEGNAYVAGIAESPDFPHNSLLDINGSPCFPESAELGFISALKASGGGPQWSTLLRNVHLRALSVDAAGNVYATGHTVSDKNPSRPCEPVRESAAPAEIRGSQSDAILIELSDGGRRLSYVARFGEPGNQEGRAVAATADGQWIFVAGQTDSSGSKANEHSGINGEMAFIAALQPCRTGAFYSRVVPEAIDINAPGIAFGPALDAFATAEARFGATRREPADAKSPVFIPIAPACQVIAR